MKIATSLAAPILVSLLCAGISSASLANTPNSKSLVDRCMSEPVSNDHLSCGSVYRQAYVRVRLMTMASAGPRQSMHRHVPFVAARHVRPKPSLKFARAPTLRAAHAIVADRRRPRERKPARLGSFSLASATAPLVVLHPRQIPPGTARLHQASALCGQAAYRSSWECGRYFLLAPYGAKNR